MLAFWLVARSIGLRIPFSVLATTLPLVFIISALPISIGGLGVREASYVALLGRAGVTATDAALLSVLFGLSFMVATLPGGLALLPKPVAFQPRDELERPVEDQVGRKRVQTK
jgi:hypothetical protein